VGCLYTLRHHPFVLATTTGSSEVATLLKKLHVRPLPRLDCTFVSIAEQRERLTVPKEELDERLAEYEREVGITD
jgi:hypothetical protein